MAVGRITGPLLKANLLRQGVDLAFETDLLYLDVINGRVGIKTTSPSHELDINGTTRTTNLKVLTQADIASFTITNNVIASSNGTINLEPSGTNPVVYQAKILVNDNLQIETNSISTTDLDADLEFNTTGTGQVNVNSNMYVDGNIHATGNITADGDIVIGDASTDSITFNADIASNIIPDATNFYDLGSDPTVGGQEWRTTYAHNIVATNITSDTAVVNGIDLVLPQGNTYYVAVNGNDANAGNHEHAPVASIKQALTLAGAGDTIHVYPGAYEEILPLEIPPGVTLRGSSLRSVTVKPTAATRYMDMFHMNGEATLEDFTLTGFYHNPTGTYGEFGADGNGTGHGVRFSYGCLTQSRSPYIRNVTVITRGTPSVLSVNSIKTEVIGSLTRIKSLIPDIVQNNAVTGTTGNTEIQDTSLPASDATTGTALQDLIDTVIYVINNGTTLAAQPTLVANGSTVTTGMLYNAAQILEANRAWILQESYSYPTVTYAPTTFNETLTKRDMGLVLDALIYDILRGGNEHSYYAGFGFWTHPIDDPYGFARGEAGHGALIDGEVLDPACYNRAMLFHSVTFITPAAETLIAKNGVRVEWLNSFTYFANKGMYLTSGDYGFAGQGTTRLRIDNRTGTWNVGNTVSYYDTDGTTLLASGTIASIDGNYVALTGKCLGFETIRDRIGKVVYVQGDAKLSTAQKKFGTASLALDGTGDYITVATQPDFNFGTEDFCLETWVYPTTTGTYRTIFDLRSNSGDTGGIILGISDINALYFYYNGNYRIGPVGSVAQNAWSHVALARVSGVTKAFVNGTQVGLDYTDTNDYAQRGVRVGADPNGNYAFAGYIDDVRISKGIGRYSSSFTTPTSALTGDLNTVLLLHFNGTNNSTTILDDGITYQDLRVTNGGPTIGTASIIDFADYSEFGAEVRSIGSACVYGDYGAYGDGVGITAYLISHNFAYIGAGKSTLNDPNERIAANEVIELNGAHIYRTSVDNEGNFSVGDSFYVNQKTGDVLFGGQSLSVTALSGVTFTDGTHTTIITSTNIDTGNLRISGNTVESLSGDVNITAADGTINLKNSTYVTGNLDVTGDVTIGGNIQIGDQSTDTVNFVAGINSNLIPATTEFYDLGTPALRWNVAYLSRAEIDGLVIDSNTISTTIGNDDLQLIANGTGRVYIPNNDVQIDQSLTVTNDFTVTTGTTYTKNIDVTGTITQIGDYNQTGNFTTSGTLQVTGNITGTGYLDLPQIKIENNLITTKASGVDLELRANGTGNVLFENIKISNNDIQSITTDSNITLVPQGTGSVIINSTQSLQIPVGTTAERPLVPVNGMIRYNTDLTRYEGYNNGYWLQLSGVIDNSGNTRILAEATPGANDNTLYFYANNNLTATIDSTKLFTQRLQTSNLDINSNTITPIADNSDINLTATGTGGVRIGNFRIRNNSITNIVSGAITEFAETGDGYVKFAGVNGVVIPSGNTLTERPLNAVVGMTRFNTDEQLVEVFNGVSWSSVAGASGGVTSVEATELGISSALIFG